MTIGDHVWFASRTSVPSKVEGVILCISADGHHALIEQFGRFDFRRLVSMDRLHKVEDEAAVA
jgi:uncharacterized protein (DUF924 family)